MRVATVDIGTNTVLLLVADRAPDGALRAVHEAATITRLGEGVDRTRTLKPEAIERTRACLKAYADVVSRHGVLRVAVVGTSAMRDAGGGDEIRSSVKELFGVEARTISGEEEARMTFRGALSGLSLQGGEVAVFDIGGGSTEVVIGTVAGVSFAHSFDVGSVRMTERHVKSDPPTDAELAAIRGEVRAALTDVPRPAPGTPVVGIAGTMTTLVAVLLRMHPYDAARVHGHELSLVQMDALTSQLASVPLSERKVMPGLEPKRADVIVAGAIVASEVTRALGATEVIVSDRGVRWGLAEELLA
jgi:exopolyphosphatase / guanosine-5'-triphosphate,3'-diphosphate pyrophosphatase